MRKIADRLFSWLNITSIIDRLFSPYGGLLPVIILVLSNFIILDRNVVALSIVFCVFFGFLIGYLWRIEELIKKKYKEGSSVSDVENNIPISENEEQTKFRRVLFRFARLELDQAHKSLVAVAKWYDAWNILYPKFLPAHSVELIHSHSLWIEGSHSTFDASEINLIGGQVFSSSSEKQLRLKDADEFLAQYFKWTYTEERKKIKRLDGLDDQGFLDALFYLKNPISNLSRTNSQT